MKIKKLNLYLFILYALRTHVRSLLIYLLPAPSDTCLSLRTLSPTRLGVQLRSVA